MPLYSTACPLPINRKIFRHRASAPFSPTDLTGLALWLKADAGVTLSGADVTAWADQSGNGNNASAVGTPSLSTVSGKTFMNFAGGYFYGYELLTSAYATIMCVARFSATRDIEMIFELISGGGVASLALYRGFNLGSGYRIYNGENVSSNSLTNNNQTYLFGATVDGDQGDLFLNGNDDGDDYCGELTPEGNYYLGYYGADGDQITTEMKMAEIVIYDRPLTYPEKTQVEEYLNTKYEIY
jgi:hypothetical protein